MNICFLLEGGKQIGFGHISRCSSLYQVFEERGFAPLLIINGDSSVQGILQNKKSEVFDWLTDQNRLFEIVSGADILIIDTYHANEELIQRLYEKAKLLVFIEDGMKFYFPGGMVVNGYIYASSIGYKSHNEIRWLLGGEYSLLRKQFQNIPELKTNEDIKSILITLGGNDLRNLTPGILAQLKKEFPEMIKTIVIGMGFDNVEKIRALADNNTVFVFNPQPEEMKTLMCEADIAICSGGMTLYELAVTQTPAIVIKVADNQERNILEWEKKGFIIYSGSWEEKKSVIGLTAHINKLKDYHLRKEISNKARKLIDGKGAMRIVREQLMYFVDNHFNIRLAQKKDLHNTFRLSNEPSVRAYSINKDPILYENHREWFNNVLKSPDNYRLFIVELSDYFAGQIRFDLDKEEAVLSISVDESLRGLGLGQKILNEAATALKKASPAISLINAFVQTTNFASKKIFENCGYKLVNEGDSDQELMKYILKLP